MTRPSERARNKKAPETANTPATPQAQATITAPEAPPSGGLAAATSSVIVQNRTPIRIVNYATPSLFPNDGGPNPYITPPMPPFFPNTSGLSSASYSHLPPPAQTTNEPRQKTPPTPPLNGIPSLTHKTPTNNTATSTSVMFQPQNHPLLVRRRHSHPTKYP
ncbi:unnamed protein product [Lactuca virosa]|uniref:Uncharacterized protein n=1 Tax=Lactuca virosa TaxID=75947 RepID=A0AAU9LVJ2_9ASTR|nr:unnamed protein product [Lactuca virosa]